MEHHHILRLATKLIIPVILLFALYVQFHGDFGPGGGFQAGVIFGAGIILHALIFGTRSTQKIITPGWTRFLMSLGVILYAGVGVASMLMGGNFLDYGALAADPHAGQHIGILLIELGVGTTVASVMIMLFYSFSRYEPED